MTGPPEYVERKVREMLAILEPAPDGATWRCGHPKTPLNTQHVGKGGERCRICRRRTVREAAFRARHRVVLALVLCLPFISTGGV